MDSTNIVKTVVESITTGCSNTSFGAGDCHWRREYLFLKEKYDKQRQRDAVAESIKVGMLEAEVKLLKDEIESYKEKIEKEYIPQSIVLQIKEDAYKSGADFSRNAAEDLVKHYQLIQEQANERCAAAEKQTEEIKSNYSALKRSLERTMLRQGGEQIIWEEQVTYLKEEIDNLRTEAESNIQTYRENMRRAEKAYNELREEFLQYTKTIEENPKWQLRVAQLEVQNEEKIRGIQKVLIDGRKEMLDNLQIQLNWAKSDFIEITTSIQTKCDEVKEALKKGRKGNPTNSVLKELLSEVLRTLEETKKKLDAAAETKENVQKALKIFIEISENVVDEHISFCQDVNESMRAIRSTFRLRLKTPDERTLDALKQLQAMYTEEEEKNLKEHSNIMLEMKRKQHLFKNLIESMKEWKASLVKHLGKIDERQNNLLKNLNEEKKLRSEEKEEAAKNLEIYQELTEAMKTKIIALENMDAFKLLASLDEFRELLDMAEDKVKKIGSKDSGNE